MKTRITFHQRLKEIQDDVLVMGSMVEKATMRCIEALKNRDLEMAREIIANDAIVNEKRFDIEERCVQLIATQQPMASDLRTLIAVLSIITDLERIGDHASGIGKIVLMIKSEPPLKPLIDIPRMAEKTVEMLRASLDAFIQRDADTARRLVAEDDIVDALYNQVFRELLTFMAADPKTINSATRLIWVAHDLERSADRISNICERTVYVVTGKMEELATTKYM